MKTIPSVLFCYQKTIKILSQLYHYQNKGVGDCILTTKVSYLPIGREFQILHGPLNAQVFIE